MWCVDLHVYSQRFGVGLGREPAATQLCFGGLIETKAAIPPRQAGRTMSQTHQALDLSHEAWPRQLQEQALG